MSDTTNDDSPGLPGLAEFANPGDAASRLALIRHFADRLSELADGTAQVYFPGQMGPWIHEKAMHLAQAATQLADAEFPPPDDMPLRSIGTWTTPSDQPWSVDSKVCPFCGAATLLTGPGDNQRIEAYCDSPQCDAREMVILVLRDGYEGMAHARSDVKALADLRRAEAGS